MRSQGPAEKELSFAKRLIGRPRRMSLSYKKKKPPAVLAAKLADIDQGKEDKGIKELRKEQLKRSSSHLIEGNRPRAGSVGSMLSRVKSSK